MVCHTEPSEKPALETVWKRADTLKKKNKKIKYERERENYNAKHN